MPDLATTGAIPITRRSLADLGRKVDRGSFTLSLSQIPRGASPQKLAISNAAHDDSVAAWEAFARAVHAKPFAWTKANIRQQGSSGALSQNRDSGSILFQSPHVMDSGPLNEPTGPLDCPIPSLSQARPIRPH